MRNSRPSLTLASLDDIEKPRDFSDVSLTHFATEPHNKLGALRGGEGGGGRGKGGNILLLLYFKFNSVILALCMLKKEYGWKYFQDLHGGGGGGFFFCFILKLTSMTTPRIGPVHVLETIRLKIIFSNLRVSGKFFPSRKLHSTR